MININQTSENSKIYIQRNITNDEPVINNYVTEDELQEQLKNINIPYLVIDHIKYDDGTWGYGIVGGDFNKVYDAIVNRKPQIMYVPSQQPTVFYIPTVFGYDTSTKKILVAVSHHNAVDLDIAYYTFEITENLVTQSQQTRNVQEKLVSGENIKTINGNDILGEGDIIIESGTDIPYLLIKYEYSNYVIYGDFDGVVEAIVNNKPYLIYTPYLDYANAYIQPTVVNYDKKTNVITANCFLHSEVDRIQKLYYTITSNNVTSGKDMFFVQPRLVSSENIKTINGSSLLGSGDITIVGSGSEILYLYKSTDDNALSTHKNHNISIRNKILSLTNTEQYPIIILKDWYNDTICNNVYARDGYVEIQCCNSRIFGEYSELTDERYELNNKGVLVKLEGNTFASKAYVDEQISNVSGGGGSTDLSNYYTKGEIDNMVGDIETILDNLIGNK